MKKISSILAIALTAGALSYSQPAPAAVSLISGNLPMALRALGILAVSGVAGVLDEEVVRDDYSVDKYYGALTIGALVGAVIGVIILDGEQSQTLSFSPLDEKGARKVGVTAVERQVFNAEIELANYLLEEVDERMKAMGSVKGSDARALWTTYEHMVSPETFSAMKKISKSLRK